MWLTVWTGTLLGVNASAQTAGVLTLAQASAQAEAQITERAPEKATERAAEHQAAPQALLGPANAVDPATTRVVNAAHVSVGEDTRFPAYSPATLIGLPDEWSVTRPDFSGSLWYRVRFDPPTLTDRSDTLALYVPWVCSAMDVVLNGQPLRVAPGAKALSTHDCNHPQLVSLPAALVRERDNTLDIKVTGHMLQESGSRLRAGGLSALQIGPQSELEHVHARQTALQVAAPQAVSATLVLMGSFMFVLGFINRRESHLAYFGALSVGWALISARQWLSHVPMGHARAEFLVCALLGFIAWAAVQFLLRYSDSRLRVIDIGLPLQCAALTLTLLAAGPLRLHTVATFWYVVLALQVAAAGAWYLHRRWASGSAWVMGLLLALTALVVLIEAAVQWAGAPAAAAHWAGLLVPVVFVLVGLRLVQQQGHALNDAEEQKAELEQRVREATAEIEHNFRQMAELRVEQVTERERKRIAGDLHDDLGAKLLTIVHTSESERISTLAREALEEMRLSVRGLTGKPVRLADALGDWRAEVISRLAQAGIEGSWEAPEELTHTLSARAYVQTTRILREATSNIIKHSGAINCAVTAGIADGDFQLVVKDDGNGISDQVDGRLDRGHGLASMKNRAKQLQGQCLVESGPGFGTVIRLTVPLDRATEGS